MKLKNTKKLKGDWTKVATTDKQKFENMEDLKIISEKIGDVTYTKEIIDSVEIIYDDSNNVRGFKTKSHLEK